MNHKNYFRIEKAIRYLNQNYDERPQWNDLARHLRLSPYHFHRLFRSWAGISPKQFLQYLTIQHAKDLLKRSKSLMDASYDSGLSGPGRLHDLFVTFDAMTPGEYKSRGKGLKIEYGIHASPFGDCLIAVTERGICHLSFVPDRGAASAKKELRSRWKNAALAENPARTRKTAEHIFARQNKNFRLVLRGTNFQIKVWEALLRIPAGCVASYEDVAEIAGNSGAVRAVAQAIAKNPVAYLIPCHRVIRKNGLISGYRWNPVRKRAILVWEAKK